MRRLNAWSEKDPTEEQFHIAVNKFLELAFTDTDVVHTTVENSNQQGGKAGRIKQYILRLKGVKDGWPDIQIFWNDDGLHSLMLELKTKSGRLSKNQKEMHRRLEGITIHTVVCRSVEEVRDALITHNVPHRRIQL
jgi:hypothetical protein